MTFLMACAQHAQGGVQPEGAPGDLQALFDPSALVVGIALVVPDENVSFCSFGVMKEYSCDAISVLGFDVALTVPFENGLIFNDLYMPPGAHTCYAAAS